MKSGKMKNLKKNKKNIAKHAVYRIQGERFKNDHSFLCTQLMQPGANQVDGMRSQMFSAHLDQCIQIAEPEPPLIFTNFENQFGEHSSGYEKVEGNYEIIKKIVKNKYNYALIVRDIDTDEYDVIFRNEAENLTEDYGFKNDNTVIDSYKEKNIIEKDTMLYHNKNYDDDENFTFGTNLNATYLAWDKLTTEDGYIILYDEISKRFQN